MRKSFLAFVFLTLSPLLTAQQSLSNDSIIKLVKAGLSDDLIVSTINASPGSYDTSADGLIALKKANVSDKVVSAIIVKSVGGGVPAAAQPVPPSVPSLFPAPAAAEQNPAISDDPAASHEAGIYIYSDNAPAGSKMTVLEPSIYMEGKTGGLFTSAMTYGIAKIKTKAVLRGAHASARVIEPQPVFYFYFEEQGAGLSHASNPFGGTSTPNEYTLLKFDIKGDSRETVIGKANVFGASGGTDDKAVTAFAYTKLRPGVYKVTLNAPLQPGEYGFISGSGSVNNRVFDFGKN